MRKRVFKEMDAFELGVIILFKYDGRYYTVDDAVLERLYDNNLSNAANVFESSDTLTVDDGVEIEKAIDDLFSVYPRDERLEDNFENIAVFIINRDNESEQDVVRDVNLGRRRPIFRAFDRGATEGHVDVDSTALSETRLIKPRKLKKVENRMRTRRFENVKTDYKGGFTDLLKQVDKLLERYFEDFQVEIIVTDNGYATVTVFSKDDDTTVTINLSYADNKAKLVSEDGKSKVVSVDVNENDYDALSDALIKIIEKSLS